MSRSPPDRMPFGVQTSERLDHCNLWPRTPESYLLSLRSCTLPSYSQSVCDEIKLPSRGLLLIVLSLWRLIQLSTVKFAYSAFNTISLKFSPRTLLALFTATTLANPGLRIRLSMVLLLQEGISGPPFLCYFESSRCTLPRWWKSTPR
ncbi:hypothetical protein TNCV_4280531 [Trichonephila clavipes]|nr:hypothetical protein TNCV_4280531 [Trichonephila clavipes]